MGKYIAVVCAMNSEAQQLIDKAEIISEENFYSFKIYTGKIYGQNILICVSGVGMVNMASAVTFISVKYPVACFLNYGVIGGYGEDVHKGDILLVKDCININSTQFDSAPQGTGISLDRGRLITFSEDIDGGLKIYGSDAKLLQFACSLFPDALPGRLGSGDVWNKEYDKIMLFHNKYDVSGEDMEGYAMYQVADKFGIPALSVKGVSNNEILGEKYDYSVMDKLVTTVCMIIENI